MIEHKFYVLIILCLNSGQERSSILSKVVVPLLFVLFHTGSDVFLEFANRVNLPIV